MKRAGSVLANDSLLPLTALIWGLAFVAQRAGMQSVGAAIGGSLVLGERPGARGVAGCAVMFAGMLVSQAPVVFSSLAAGRARG